MQIASIVAIIVVILVGGLWYARAQGDDRTLLPANEFMTRIQETPGAVVLDVRTPQEYASGHIAGAQNIDYYNRDFSAQIAQLDTDATYFVYCRSGSRSSSAVAQLKAQGISRVYELRGGIGSAPELIAR